MKNENYALLVLEIGQVLKNKTIPDAGLVFNYSFVNDVKYYTCSKGLILLYSTLCFFSSSRSYRPWALIQPTSGKIRKISMQYQLLLFFFP